MKSSRKRGIGINPSDDYPGWYQEVIREAELAEHSSVRGSMVLRPWGYALWEGIREALNERFRTEGVENAYFPLLIPMSAFEKEGQHVEGFAEECAIVTHHRLKRESSGEVIAESPLEEPFVIRPTSEMIIGEHMKGWIHSYRDLPIKINQWANVMRWERRPRLFLRSTEILWQEGHTVYATAEEADQNAQEMAQLYHDFSEEVLAIPTVLGKKTESERFPGAHTTYTLEGIMGDGKALQMGTSHFLGQNFAHACDLSFQDRQGQKQVPWTSSWGVSTRLIGAMIMVHADEDGMVIPPAIAGYHVVIIPRFPKEGDRTDILRYCHNYAESLRSQSYSGKALRVYVDQRELSAGEKKWRWIKKGVPLRVEIGPREIQSGEIGVSSRLGEGMHLLVEEFPDQLAFLQKRLLIVAKKKQVIHSIDCQEDFIDHFSNHQGCVLSHWSEDPTTEERLRCDHGVTVRCLPFSEQGQGGHCLFTGQLSRQRALFGRAY
ncbi:MAG: proline--tRNA ligase [Chlamydiota bacterium]|nr:proline--tRNA ligase [Chlamydiota bacterium]